MIALYRPRPNYSNYKDEVCYLLQQSIGGYFPLSFTVSIKLHAKEYLNAFLMIKKFLFNKTHLVVPILLKAEFNSRYKCVFG